MANVMEQLQTIEGFDQLPQDRQEALIVEALQKEVAGAGSRATPIPLNAQGEPTQELPGGLTAPRPLWERVLPGVAAIKRQFTEEPTFEEQTTPTPESQQLTAPFFTKENAAPAIGSLAGSLLAGKVGDIAGTTAGYGFNLLTGIEKPSLMGALTTLGPSLLFNAKGAVTQPPGGLVGKAAGGLARSSQAGKEAALADKTRRVAGSNARIQDYNTQQLAQEGVQQTAFEQGEAARAQLREAQRQAVTGANTQQHVSDEAAAGLVEAFNKKAASDFEHSRMLQDRFQARQRGEYQSDLVSWQAVMDKHAADTEALKQAQARFAQTQTAQEAADPLVSLTTRAGNVSKIEKMVQDLPTPPTKEEVKLAYAEVEAQAKLNVLPDGTPIRYDIPEIREVQKGMQAMADLLKKRPGTTTFTDWLEARAKDKTPMTLQDIQAWRDFLNDEMSNLRSPSMRRYAAQEGRLVAKTIDALDKGTEAIAQQAGIPNGWRALYETARQLYLKQRTHAELTQFVARDMLTRTTGGAVLFDPVRALQALEQRHLYDNTRRYLQQVVLPSGENLYEHTVKNLTAMSQAGMSQKDLLKWHALTTGEHLGSATTPLPSGHPALRLPPPPAQPVNPTSLSTPTGIPGRPITQAPAAPGTMFPVPDAYTPQPFQASKQYMSPLPAPTADTRPGTAAILGNAGMRIGLIGGAAAAGMSGHYIGGAAALGGAALLPAAISQLLMTPGGQKHLLTLMREQGPQLTPTMVGFITAAVKSQLPTAGTAPAAASR